MKPSFTRRVRRRSSSHETSIAKKENQQQSFFGDSAHDPFFQPQAAIQRKCDKCEEEDKNAKKNPDTKEEEKVQRMTDKKEEEKLQRMSEPEKKEDEKKVQAKENTTSSTAVAGNTSGFVSSISNSGTAMPKSLQIFFANRMGHDFSDVQIHAGTEAAQSAKSINAEAYTYGNHIVVSNGKYQPDTESGKALLAHELVHVMQQKDADAKLHRKVEEEPVAEQPVVLPAIRIEVEGSQIQNTTHNGDCNGVSVSGNTTANYSSPAALSGRPTVATDCTGCTGNSCITVSGNVVSTFNTAPVVSLPQVPGGLNACERKAVRAFINGTLSQHEQQHVAAFNTYRGVVSTPFTFTGCRSDLAAEVQAVHDNIEVPRRQASDDASALLDANGANVFNITCECPDPVADGK